LYFCPICQEKLEAAKQAGGLHFECHHCSKSYIATSVLRKRNISGLFVHNVLNSARAVNEYSGDCPYCKKSMKKHRQSSESGNLEFDVCTTCLVLGIKTEDLEKLPLKKADEEEPDPSKQVLTRLSLEEQRMKSKYSNADNTYLFNFGKVAPVFFMMLFLIIIVFVISLSGMKNPIITFLFVLFIGFGLIAVIYLFMRKSRAKDEQLKKYHRNFK